jgi:formate-dependent nitrite reductase membrane component NrfD
MLFIVSAASISVSLILLLADRSRWTMPGIVNLHRMDTWVVALELIVLIAFIVSLGPVVRAWLTGWGIFLLAIALFGMLLPIALSWRRNIFGELNLSASAALVLLGGFLLRVVSVFAAQGI